MNTTPTQSAEQSAVIHRNQRIFATQEKARRALEEVRCHAWRLGARLNDERDTREQDAAHAVSDAVAELVALALHVEDDEVAL